MRSPWTPGDGIKIGWIAPTVRISDEGWLQTGDAILSFVKATPWLFGDWYSTRSAIAAERLLASGWDGPSIHSLQNYASVAKAFLHSRRREAVSFAHHAELVILSEAEQDSLLDWCDTPDALTKRRPSVAELRKERQRRELTKLPPPKPPRNEPPKVVPPPASLKIGLPEPVSPPAVRPPVEAEIEPLPPDDVAIAVTLYVPADLHAWAREAATGEDMPLGVWIIRLIERARDG